MKTSNKNDALTAISDLSNSAPASSPYFQSVSLADVVTGLNQYVSAPDSLHQGLGTNLCGPSALTSQVFLKYNPLGFVNIVFDLYNKGNASYDNGSQLISINPSVNVKQFAGELQNRFASVVSQMFLFSLREHFAEVNYFKKAQDTIWASTILGGEKKVADQFFAFTNDRFGETALWGIPDKDVHAEDIQSRIDSGKIAIVLVDSGYLENLDNRYPNFGKHETGNLAGTHYICVLGASADQNNSVTFKWWDYGAAHQQTMSLENFKRMIWGGIFIEKPY
jgi:hypothetical protein